MKKKNVILNKPRYVGFIKSGEISTNLWGDVMKSR